MPENGTELSRREELLAVATRLFAARGYHGTRINDVADVVGLNKATVYHYYASKSLILLDIYREAANRTVAAVHDEPDWSAREAIFHFTRRLLANIANNIDGAAVYFQESPYITEWFTEEQVEYIRAAEAQVYEHVRDVIDRGIASGEFYECDLSASTYLRRCSAISSSRSGATSTHRRSAWASTTASESTRPWALVKKP